MKSIAETAWHHAGNFVFFKNLVENIASKANSDYIKFHISLDVDEYMCSDHPGYQPTKDALFSKQQWETIINIALSYNKKLMLLFNDKKAIDFGMQFEPELVEIHSVCLNDMHLLEHLKKYNNKNIPIVLGVGGTSLYEIENAITFLNTKHIVLMHGFQNYPTRYEDINLDRIRKIINLYPTYKHGYADHTAWDEKNNNLITLMGAAIGMQFIEKHVTTNQGEVRVDWQAAIGIEQFNDLIQSMEILQKCNGNGELKLNEGEKKYSIFGPNKKAAFLQNDLDKGAILEKKDIQFKRTVQLSETSQIEVWEMLGKEAKEDLKKDTLISKTNF